MSELSKHAVQGCRSLMFAAGDQDRLALLPRARRLGRAGLYEVATITVAVAALAASVFPAQAQFASLTAFGDSYADTGAAPGGAFRILGTVLDIPGVYPCVAPLASCRFTGSTNFNDTLQSLSGLPGLTNYAIGGARTDNSNTIGQLGSDFGFPYQLRQLALNGTRFGERDFVTLSIGGNDESYMTSGDTLATVNARATLAAHNAVYGGIAVDGFVTGGVQQLVAAGARNIAWLGSGNSKYFPQPEPVGVALTTAQRDAWAATYLYETQVALRPLAQAGIRIFMLDFGILQARVAADPGRYGFSGTQCEAGPIGEGVPLNVAGCFYENSVHPTGAAMAVVGAYMANQIDAPTTVMPQGSIATGVAATFVDSVFGRLDAYRTFQNYGVGSAIAETFAGTNAMATTTPVAFAPQSRWSVFVDASYPSGSTDREFYAAGADWHAIGGTLGVEVRLDPRVRLGAVFGYSEPKVDLDVQNTSNDIQAYQIAGYGSFTDVNWFADALFAYGRQDFSLDRSGVIDVVHGSTSADTLAVAAKGGYLVDVGPVRAGPIAGIAYTRAVIDAYTETGDSLLTMRVDQQSLDALTGSAGLQVRVPVQLSSGLYSPFFNVTAEHDFLGSGRTLTTTQVTTPLLPVLTPVPEDDRTYGKVAVGVAAVLTGNVSANVTAATTFARDGGNDIMVSGGIEVAF
ncbi:autotransporter domain-containing protein [Thiocystis violacea]|uniref:autotransporter domain-containing protein n=1 Tax=Thiocystis violacea TaxID=13725 RepID=UPI0019055D03|nr:autotransporter domain-containing protein [Thiocystis violacea]